MPQSETFITVAMRSEIEAVAREAHFDAAGIAAVPLPDSPEERLQRERFTAWIANGYAGEMGWLKRVDSEGRFLRSSLHTALPWVRSVVICAVNYDADAPSSLDPAPLESGWIARYAWSGKPASDEGRLVPADYHDVLLRQLKVVEAHLRSVCPTIETRCYVDTGPIVERHLAQLAGLGWIGKNTCLLNQSLGSWLLLGVVLTSLPVAAEATLDPASDRCGSCTRCIEACPTDALVAPYQMDASRCIAYLTIEKKKEIAEELRPLMGRQIFGCDICQDVCPWNRRAPVGTHPEMQARQELVNPALAWLAEMDGRAFQQHFRGSPLERTGRRRLLRNVAIAMGNSGDAAYVPQLEAWASGNDAVLAEAARWAILTLQTARE